MRKKALCIMIAVMVAIGGAACSSPPKEAGGPDAGTVPGAEPEIVEFNDPVLEAAVREAMNKPEGDITVTEAESLRKLGYDLEWQREIPPETQIKDISALKYFTNLEEIELQFHAITDISPLAGLTKLKGLMLGGNQISDITPLAGLQGLGALSIFNCGAEDYSTLSELPYLNTLFLSYSTFSDLSVLTDLKDLQTLYIDHTQVSDVSLLADMPNLKRLKLEGSLVTDYSPLKDLYPNLEEKDFEL